MAVRSSLTGHLLFSTIHTNTDCAFAQEPEYNDAEKDQAIQNINIYAANINYPFNLSYVVYSSLAQPNSECLFYCHQPFIVEFSYTDFIYSIGYDDPLPEYYYTIAVEIRNATGQPIKTFYPVFSGHPNISPQPTQISLAITCR